MALKKYGNSLILREDNSRLLSLGKVALIIVLLVVLHLTDRLLLYESFKISSVFRLENISISTMMLNFSTKGPNNSGALVEKLIVERNQLAHSPLN